jgi:hypothetical protein
MMIRTMEAISDKIEYVINIVSGEGKQLRFLSWSSVGGYFWARTARMVACFETKERAAQIRRECAPPSDTGRPIIVTRALLP